MDYKYVSDLSFFDDDQKEWFKNYIVYENGDIYNEKTDKYVSKTLHGIRGFVVNLSIHIDGNRMQRQIVVHKAVADLFIGPIKDGEKLVFLDGDKENVKSSNLIYRMTKSQQSLEYSKCLNEMKGITDDGRICNICEEFVKWDLIAGPDDKKLSICKRCVSKRGMEYQKSVNYSGGSVSFDTYADRMLESDDVSSVDGFLGVACSKCKEVFLITRGRVLNRIKSIKNKCDVLPLICAKCKEEK